jgi:hypothetical protein
MTPDKGFSGYFYFGETLVETSRDKQAYQLALRLTFLCCEYPEQQGKYQKG